MGREGGGSMALFDASASSVAVGAIGNDCNVGVGVVEEVTAALCFREM